MKRSLGILGGGQLGRMLALAARPLGLSVTVLDPNPDAPGRAAAGHIETGFDDPAGLDELSKNEFITFEFENIPDSVASQLSKEAKVHPSAEALRVAQDRWIEKNTFVELGVETPRFRKLEELKDAEAAFDELGELVLKTRRFGYDGKGQAVVRSKQEVAAAYETLNGAPAIAEELIPFERELSVLICRGQHTDGRGKPEVQIYPLTENVHEDGVLRRSTAPAQNVSATLQKQAALAAAKLVDHFDYVGVLALELFQVDGRLLANEFAPRVHNSGHWTIEGAVTSQFENHVRAVCGLPLGSAGLRSPSVMTNLIGKIPDHHAVLAIEDTHLHDYEKAARPGRKVGHTTSLGETTQEADQRAARVRRLVD